MAKPGPREIEARERREAQWARDQAEIKAAKAAQPKEAKLAELKGDVAEASKKRGKVRKKKGGES